MKDQIIRFPYRPLPSRIKHGHGANNRMRPCSSGWSDLPSFDVRYVCWSSGWCAALVKELRSLSVCSHPLGGWR